MSSRMRLIALFAALVLFAGACSDSDDSGGDGDGGGGDAEISFVNSGQLTVCSDIPYEPFEFETDDGGFTGYDIEIVREIADDLGVELEVRVTPFDGILGALEVPDCDLVASALTITGERAQQVDFSDPYYETDQSLLVADAATYPDLASLAGQRIGVQSGTTGADYADENKPDGATIVELPGAAELFSALAAGDIVAILQDEPVNSLRAATDDDLTVVETFQTDESYGFAIRKGNTALLDAVNAALADLESNGRIDEIFKQFFG